VTVCLEEHFKAAVLEVIAFLHAALDHVLGILSLNNFSIVSLETVTLK
jgi:hypothetical protein